MNCEDFTNKLDSYFDTEAGIYLNNAMKAHCRACPNCNLLVMLEAGRRQSMRSVDKIPPLPADLAHRAFAKLDAQVKRQARKRTFFSSAIAAGLMCTVFALHQSVSPTLDRTNPMISAQDVDVVNLTVAQMKNVKLLFESAVEMKGVYVTVDLPEYLEVHGYAGRQTLKWRSDIIKGNNVLQLPVIARAPHAGELTAILSIGDAQRVFKVHIIAIDGDRHKKYSI